MSRRNFFESRNPAFKEGVFQRASQNTLDGDMAIMAGEKMTVQGAVNKTFLLTLIMLVTAVFSYGAVNPIWTWGGAIGGLVVVIIAAFRPQNSNFLAPAYAALEGLFVGGISAMYASAFNGIVLNAVSLTIGVLLVMLFVYQAGIIKVTDKFRSGVIMATGAILLVYVVNFVLSFFGIHIPYLHEGGTIGMLISLAIIGVASLNLLLDFDNFEKGEQYGAPAYMEWYSAMGLLITLVWLYIEILRFIAIFSSSD